MCGIYGVVGGPYSDAYVSAAKSIAHRGPDAFGEWRSIDVPVYLAHCRLAIIDLTDAGRQPMANEDGSVHITFNGEIYNYQSLRRELVAAGHEFRSHSDTEVIVHGFEEWGTDVVRKLRGIFAFAIWNERTQSCFLARDHLGVKPLYYGIKNQHLVFSSEPRAILATPGWKSEIRPEGIAQYLQLSYTCGEASLWKDIFRLPAGECAEFKVSSEKLNRHRYWHLADHIKELKYEEALEQAAEITSQSVKEQLISDVPVGVFLSGGVDSSLVCALASRHESKVTSLCIDFTNWEGSEAEDALRVAKHLGTDHLVGKLDLTSSPLNDAATHEAFFRTWDEPMANATIIPAWYLSRYARQHVTVALSGDGGDELFGGYNWYRQCRATPRRRASWIAESIRRRLGFGRPWPQACANEKEYFQFLHWPTLSRLQIESLFPDWGRATIGYDPINGLRSIASAGNTKHRMWQALDVYSFLIDDNLARTDRASMAFGLEVRVPLLDHRLAELAFSVPVQPFELQGPTKPMLRKLLEPMLPQETVQKKKQGFSFPIEKLVSYKQMYESVRDGCLVGSGIMSANSFTNMFEDGDRAKVGQLWILYVLEHWMATWGFGGTHHVVAGAQSHVASHAVN